MAAHRYYRLGRAQTEIAREFGVSRFKVARWLEYARDNGIVKIEIALPGQIDAERSVRLSENFGLSRALVVSVPDKSPNTLYGSLGAAAASLLSTLVQDGDVVGFSSGRTLVAMARYLVGMKAQEIVQITGLIGPPAESSAEVIRRVAVSTSATADVLYAPLLVRDAATARALKVDPDVLRTTSRFSKISTAVVSIGSWSPPNSQVYDALEAPTRRRLLDAGACAEVCAHPVSRTGKFLEGIEDRLLGISAEELARVPEVVAVAGGENKGKAIAAVLATGVVTTLVTDSATADVIMSASGPNSAST